MSLQSTPTAQRVHIAFFGKRNAGKSSLVNAITEQSLSVVSDILGTTTDPVKKAMELLPIGPVMIIDTPGFDDAGSLGDLRVEKTKEILRKTDIAILVTDCSTTLDKEETEFLNLIKEKNIPYIIAYNKADLLDEIPPSNDNAIWVSAILKKNIDGLKKMIADLSEQVENPRHLVKDLLEKNDTVVLVTPIDESAPKGRIILPQQQTIRDVLDTGCTAVVCQTEQLSSTLKNLNKSPKMVICDSQAFSKVSKLVPEVIPLTSFSILFARYKGDLKLQVKGASMLSKLSDGDKVLISEGCTHHRQCGDIGTVKLPEWIKDFCKADIDFDFTSGGDFPKDLSKYKLIVHCGGCMLNDAEMKHRLSSAKKSGIPIVNYGIAIAHTNGILKRSLELFPDVLKLL